MASTSECTGRFEKLELSDPSASMTASNDSEYVTALASESERAATPLVTARSDSMSSVEEQIERSKSHWSELAEMDSDDEAVAEIDNVEVFRTLQLHPTWGFFFQTFGYDLGIYRSCGELEVGEKFAEGGQAELYYAQVKWQNPKLIEYDLNKGREWVIKVFKKGTFLRHLQLQMPPGFLQDRVNVLECAKLGNPLLMRYICQVLFGTLLKDGRFAFLMARETEDLRTRIDRLMMMRGGKNCGPFSKDDAEVIMYCIALGMDRLHNLGIVHRDLKASNVLLYEGKMGQGIFVADFECSVGIVGIGFFRAPEILQACKDRVVNKSKGL
jgi:serine/threonine protein kinase